MRRFNHTFVVLAMFFGTVLGDCNDVRRNFKDKTQITCPEGRYMKGLIRGKVSGNKDKIDDIVGLTCCTPSLGLMRGSIVDYADWQDNFDINNRWNSCPLGYFARGLQRGDSDFLQGVQAGRCAKPVNHPRSYKSCYIQTVSWTKDQYAKRVCRDNHFVVSFYRDNGNGLSDLDKFKCCEMLPPPEITDTDDVSSLIMDKTRLELADLAHNLGFGWAFGCRALNVGEQFIKSGDTWTASMNGDCGDAAKKKNRLKIKYGDWRMLTADMTYGSQVVESLVPEVSTKGVVVNNEDTPAMRTVVATVETTRSVSHEKSKSFTSTIDIDITLTNPMLGFDWQAGYSFSYSDSTTTVDTSGEEQVSTFNIHTAKEIPPHGASNYSLMIYKSRATMPYTAVVLSEFSVTFESFLRGGMGKNPGDNYHEDYHGKTGHPDFSYTFGDQAKSFVEDLKQKSTHNSPPWLWSQVKSAWPLTETIIEYLLDNSHYEFTVSGEFVEISGTRAEIEWTDVETDEVVGKRNLPGVTSSHEADRNGVIDLGKIKVAA